MFTMTGSLAHTRTDTIERAKSGDDSGSSHTGTAPSVSRNHTVAPRYAL